MKEFCYTIKDPVGIHARPAGSKTVPRLQNCIGKRRESSRGYQADGTDGHGCKVWRYRTRYRRGCAGRAGSRRNGNILQRKAVTRSQAFCI